MSERKRCPECGQLVPPSAEETDRILAQARAERDERTAARLAREAAETAPERAAS